MHYIRLLRPASVNASNPKSPRLSLTLTITTDLGDTFLAPDSPVKILFTPKLQASSDGVTTVQPVQPVNGPAIWKDGMRVLKVKLPWKKAWSHGRINLCIEGLVSSGNDSISSRDLQMSLPWRRKQFAKSNPGLIAPLTVELDEGRGSDVAVREFIYNFPESDDVPTMFLNLEEEIGESIARHIWDAGLVTAALLLDGCRVEQNESESDHIIPITRKSPNVLELGSGVGILGVALGMAIRPMASAQGIELEKATVLLTDLPEAEERARANVERYQVGAHAHSQPAEILYENLDWDDGSKGKFGPLVLSRCWDCIVLSDCTYNVDSFPVLVETLSALHAHNQKYSSKHDDITAGSPTTKVILSTKPRHDSEKALFGMLQGAGWKHHLFKSIPLPRLGDETETVEIYSIEKGPGSETTGSKKRRSDDAAQETEKKFAKIDS
ncbi:hypothetical protein PFICI_02656 [Pestalotiopsis fici W106-1]|uniref:Uncharacterized protein n=1 Tax=Pestalotiopsis fici (strain W106-1 / CGMCC3.15140) TaxID=1229662 RepID=W3XHC9_PESFW|nr:uncharacterized protein PFICI_02656 [Pestalotiopsis fici W106-1]ETS84631.1 hypothetical protein PFICI_02656 [Pestalotiopsis fici W106-1]